MMPGSESGAMKKSYDVIVVGGGPAGLAAALEARKTGAKQVLVLERDRELGGILLQCIHNGFGSVLFKKDFPGPAYARKFIDELRGMDIDVLLDTMVLDITSQRKLYATNSKDGYLEFDARAIVLAMGCRERTRAQVRLPGSRPAGVYTAGLVQRLVNVEGFMPGRDFVILGSGDIGMIMARRLTLEGARVHRVVELMPFLTGLRRNYVQCLQDFGIPLSLGTTIKRIVGDQRVEAVETIRVDECFNPIAGTEELLPCDTLMLSVGLIPENELSKRAGVELDPLTGGPVVDERMATNVPGIYAAGNVVTIYDLVDYVSKGGFTAGRQAALYALDQPAKPYHTMKLVPGESVRNLIPQTLNRELLADTSFLMELRVNRFFDQKVLIEVVDGNNVISSFREKYARPAEMITVKMDGNALLNGTSPETDTLTVRVVERA